MLKRMSLAQSVDQGLPLRDTVGIKPEVRLGGIPSVALAGFRPRAVVRLRPLDLAPGGLALPR